MKVTFFEKDLGMGRILREAAKLRKKPFVKCGVTQKKGSRLHLPEVEGQKVTATVADIAKAHEYGVEDKGIPERSFIRSTVERNQAKYDAHIVHLSQELFDAASDMTVEKALGIIGQEVSSDMKATIRAKIPPPLKQATINAKNRAVIAKSKAKIASLDAKKAEKGYLTKAQGISYEAHGSVVASGGDSTPLIDKGQMINAISYEVVKDGGTDGVEAPEGEGGH